ncbi:TetR/AcrR family transcriptional regulator [Nocardioides sp. Y6]|uniref:TetR/AcrR family transcriptional regulator n=1 Tax=Nocardioides malaquae TaxID=2773426 RepID=A0ABR9RQH9_9ACTN|nr:TetR-like C-terminal domain-containing protein [Nocardioides malaquae]MBE7323832.1 TetR/AcrR family transcriptional regulator [Nocardioides malaquae]
MTKGPTPRQLAREANIARIKELALEQLAAEGAAGLSLRAVARELNLVSSAIYRYYPSRDDLVTDLVLDAYADLAAAVEQAVAAARPGRGEWVAACEALRAWARRQPHRYALVYGSAIPGYEAPGTTVAPAVRVLRALALPVVRALGGRNPEGLPAPGAELRTQLDQVAEGLEVDATPAVLLSLVHAFARLQGLVGLELNGHFVGGFEPADLLYAAAVEDEADRWGLT